MQDIEKKCGYFPLCEFPVGKCRLVDQVGNQAEHGFRKDRFGTLLEDRRTDYENYLERVRGELSKCADPKNVIATINSVEPNFD